MYIILTWNIIKMDIKLVLLNETHLETSVCEGLSLVVSSFKSLADGLLTWT